MKIYLQKNINVEVIQYPHLSSGNILPYTTTTTGRMSLLFTGICITLQPEVGPAS